MSTNNPQPEDEVKRKLAIKIARERLGEEGELEFDDNAVVSWGGENGAYVQAWAWVDFSGTALDDDA